ncbi:thioredoxin domain-containing protein [Corynebacterium hansenii]|uniref:Thioredoxin domain-containing protein n=1 Tax=Corynebacterium hansenii TaxID=394964 RepID=A0ABV7ZSJ3_9CORY|nr:thioredoxin domain-containing protein [Corynebacterium hansenii]WJZ00941.1 Disulfide bond formation protein D precursor [Corynebacterium hansenii]
MSDTANRSKKAAPGMVPALIALVVVVLAIAGVGGYMVWGGSSDSEPAKGAASGEGGTPHADPGSGGEGLSFLARRDENDRMAVGPVDAPVVLVNYSDWRCPFCAKFARDMEPKLISDYVETGKLRIEWRDMPLFGGDSKFAARAGRAAAEQDKFHDFHRVVMAAAPERGHADLDEQALMSFAEEAGIPDLEKFRADMLSDRFDEAIDKDAEEGSLYGVNSTPTFIVGKGAIVGAQPLQTFIDAIESQLPAGAGE